MQVYLIINPNASKGKAKEKAERIKKIFNSSSVDCFIAYTSGPGDAEKLAIKGVESGYSTIIAAGGDGTVNEVINGIMRVKGDKNVKMGIIPIGRGNDFAWMAKIPKDIEKATNIIIEGKTEAIDVGFAKGSGRENGVYFLNGVGFGFEPTVNFIAQDYKHVNGMASYILAFIHVLFNPPKGYDLSLDIDGEKYSIKSQQLSINNGRRMGSTFLMTPRAEINDGLLDYTFTKKLFKGLKLLLLVKRFLQGGMITDKENFVYGNARKIVIDSPLDEVVSHVDGEEFSRNGKHFEIEILPKAIKLYQKNNS